MAINNILGSTGFVISGDYSATTTYNFLNVVRFNGDAFVCRVRTGVLNSSPETTFTDNTNWFAFIENFTSADQAKLDLISITQAVNLDTIETDVAASKLKTDLISVLNAINLDTIATDVAASKLKTDLITVATAVNVNTTDSNATTAKGVTDLLPTSVEIAAGDDGQTLIVNSGKLELQDFPTSSPTIIADTAELVTFRGSGYVMGTQFITTADDILARQTSGTPAIIEVVFPETITGNNALAVFTGAFGDTAFMEITNTPDPALTNWVWGSFNGSTDPDAVLHATNGEMFVHCDQADSTGTAYATTLMTVWNALSDTTATTLAGGSTTPAQVIRNSTVSIVGGGGAGDRTMRVTGNDNGVSAISANAVQGGVTQSVVQAGSVDTNATLGLNSLYQVLTPTSLINLTNGTVVTVL